MSTFKFHISISLDGYVAGPDQGPDDPLGRGGLALHEWVGATRTFQSMEGVDGQGETGIDDDHFAAAAANVGAYIMGRNMFGPIRGPWENEDWQGWWGPNPPYHTDVFVLTSHARRALTMEGGTTFHFVTDGIEAALDAATQAADGHDVLLAGGANVAQQYLRARLLDEIELHVPPVFLGAGARLFDELGGGPNGYENVGLVSSPVVAHFTFRRAEVTE